VLMISPETSCLKAVCWKPANSATQHVACQASTEETSSQDLNLSRARLSVGWPCLKHYSVTTPQGSAGSIAMYAIGVMALDLLSASCAISLRLAHSTVNTTCSFNAASMQTGGSYTAQDATVPELSCVYARPGQVLLQSHTPA
jgi:hypothetical protein